MTRKVYAPWMGWPFTIEGLFNFAGGVLPFASMAPIVGVTVPVSGAAALSGYGWGVVRGTQR